MKWIEFELHARWQNKTRNSRAHNKTIHTNCFQKCATAVECFKKMYNWIQFKLYLLNKEEGKQERSPEEWKKSENFMQTLCIWTWCKLFALRGGTQAQQQNEAISFFCRLKKKNILTCLSLWKFHELKIHPNRCSLENLFEYFQHVRAAIVKCYCVFGQRARINGATTNWVDRVILWMLSILLHASVLPNAAEHLYSFNQKL